MSVTNGLEPKVVTGFKGLFSRGSLQNIPEDHLSFCDNCIFPGNDLVGIREALDLLDTVTLPVGETAISVFPYSIINASLQRTDFLYLTDHGKVIDGATGTVLFTASGGTLGLPTDFSCINYGGRVFVSLKFAGSAWYNNNALDSSLHYYDGTNYVPFAGDGPTTAPVLSETATGSVDAGAHIVGVSYLYKYGYISPPSPLATIVSDGSHSIHIASIPVSSDPNVVGRVILITAADKGTLYFVPGGTINDNTTTTFDYDGPDTALIASADYLQDLLTIIPNGSSIKIYHGRLAVIGPHGVENNILFSNQLSPETFNVVTGAVAIPIDFQALNPNTAVIINDTFYVLKPNGTFATQDNDGDPNTWNVTSIDAGLGGFDTGVSNFAGNFNDILDNALVCNPRGLMLFTGSYHDTPLTFKIDSLWKTINPKLMYLLQIGHDIWNKRVYIAVPLFFSATNNFILMMDYSEGLTPQTVKWSRWYFRSHPIIPKMIMGVYLIAGSGAQNIAQQLVLCFGDSNKIFTLNGQKTSDEDVTTIMQEIDTAPIAFGGVGVFLGIMLNIEFNKTLEIQGFNLDKSVNYDIGNITNNATATAAWAILTHYNVGDYVTDTLGHYQLCITAGTSSALTPAWNDTGGITTESTGVRWQDTGTSPPDVAKYYHGVEIYRPFNITTEKLIIKFVNDITVDKSWFTLNRIDVYGRMMWAQRSQIIQNQ